MSEKPISPLRQRMLDDMNVRRFVPDTQREYIRAVNTPELDCMTPRHCIHRRIHPKIMFIIAVQQPINRTTRTTRSDPLRGSPSRSVNTPRSQLKSP